MSYIDQATSRIRALQTRLHEAIVGLKQAHEDMLDLLAKHGLLAGKALSPPEEAKQARAHAVEARRIRQSAESAGATILTVYSELTREGARYGALVARKALAPQPAIQKAISEATTDLNQAVRRNELADVRLKAKAIVDDADIAEIKAEGYVPPPPAPGAPAPSGARLDIFDKKAGPYAPQFEAIVQSSEALRDRQDQHYVEPIDRSQKGP